ncbi:hypothetical protein ACTFIZ_007572 [Dictyostelium cf. discoideum]
MKSWEQSTLKVYNSSYTRFLNFCILNSLDPSNITLVVFMDYLTHLFKIKPPLAFSTINNHRSMLNQLLLLRNQTDIVNDPFITRIMTGIHKLRPSSANYKEIWDANKYPVNNYEFKPNNNCNKLVSKLMLSPIPSYTFSFIKRRSYTIVNKNKTFIEYLILVSQSLSLVSSDTLKKQHNKQMIQYLKSLIK